MKPGPRATSTIKGSKKGVAQGLLRGLSLFEGSVPSGQIKVCTANCETLEQLGCRSSPAICLFCRQPSINTFLNEQLLGSTFPSLIYIHTLTSPFPRIKMVQGGHRRHMPEPVKGIFVTMSRQLSSKDISIRYIWHWCTPQTNTCLSCNGNRAALSFRNQL